MFGDDTVVCTASSWQSYLSCGGFPRAVAEYHRDGAVSQAFINDLGAWLHRDVDADAPSDPVPLLPG